LHLPRFEPTFDELQQPYELAIAATVLQKKQVLGEILTNPLTSAPFQSNIRSQLQQLQ
jgi:hypothetical protein